MEGLLKFVLLVLWVIIAIGVGMSLSGNWLFIWLALNVVGLVWFAIKGKWGI